MTGLFEELSSASEKNNASTIKQENDNEKTNKENNKKTKLKKEPKIKVLEEQSVESINKREIKEIDSFSGFSERILQQFKNKNLHHAIMLSGNFGIGKATCAYWLISQMILLKHSDNEEEKQAQLQLLAENIHPDVFILSPSQQEEINIDDIRRLISRISLRSTYGEKFVLIDDINSININGLNALLKTLEEPPENTFFFIVNNQTSKILDTIYSRCRLEKLSITRNECIKILQKHHDHLKYDEVCAYTDMSGNSICIAEVLIDCGLLKHEVSDLSMLKKNLNEIYSLLDKYDNNKLSNNMKLTILGRLMLYFINNVYKKIVQNEKSDLVKNIASQSNQIIKQFIDIKTFDLPVKFV